MLLDSLTAKQQLRVSDIRDLLPFRKPLGLRRRHNAHALKKALPDRMPLLNRGLDEAAHGREAMRVFGGGSND